MALPNQNSRRLNATVVLIIGLLLSVVSMTVWVREGEGGVLHQIHDATTIITAPLQSAGYSLTSPLRSLGRMVDNNGLSNSEIEALRDENERLRSEIIRLQENESETQLLYQLLEIRDAYGLESVGARVISRSPDSWNRTITINKGTNAGVRVGMPVMSANGLIGQVESAGPSSAVVRLITDQNSGVAVFIQGSRAEGIMYGSPDGTLYLRFIGLDVDVQPGATIVTSGAGGVYPKGIPVGTVQSVSFLPSDVEQSIVIKPLDRSAFYEVVLVIIGDESEIRPADGSTPNDGGGGEPSGGRSGGEPSSSGVVLSSSDGEPSSRAIPPSSSNQPSSSSQPSSNSKLLSTSVHKENS